MVGEGDLRQLAVGNNLILHMDADSSASTTSSSMHSSHSSYGSHLSSDYGDPYEFSEPTLVNFRNEIRYIRAHSFPLASLNAAQKEA